MKPEEELKDILFAFSEGSGRLKKFFLQTESNRSNFVISHSNYSVTNVFLAPSCVK